MSIGEIEPTYRICPLCFNAKGYYLRKLNSIPLLRCNACNMVFADMAEKVCNYKPETILSVHRSEPLASVAYFDLIIDEILNKYSGVKIRILDFGCGSGMFLRRARKKGLIPYGVDISDYSKIASQAFDLRIIHSDLIQYNFPSNYFDVVFSHATFEHLYEPFKIAEELFRILKPNGLFITSGVPNYNTLSVKGLKNFDNNYPPGHVNFFEVETMRFLYEKIGLKSIDISTYGFNVWILLNMLKRRKDERQNKINISNDELSNDEIIYELKNLKRNLDTLSIPFIYKFLAFLFTKAIIPKMGQAISAWGLKPSI